jgi:hypothetical protein
MNAMEKGFVKTLTIIVIGFCIMFIVVAMMSKYIDPANFKSAGTTSGSAWNESATSYGQKSNSLLSFLDDIGPTYSDSNATWSEGPKSSSSGRVTLGSGNASYSAQPFEEYVTIENTSNAPIDITGWRLENGKGLRPIQNSTNDYFYPTPESATIGYGTEFLDPSGNFRIGDIVLKPGDKAIVTTGGPFTSYPFKITTSFRENMCLGYLKNYPFEPYVNQSCPVIVNDPDARTMTDQCYNYMQGIYSCSDPAKEDKARFEEQTSICRNFISARLGYPACVGRNQYTPAFSSNQWRVFLGRKLELWGSERETITLYDRGGSIVSRISY